MHLTLSITTGRLIYLGSHTCPLHTPPAATTAQSGSWLLQVLPCRARSLPTQARTQDSSINTNQNIWTTNVVQDCTLTVSYYPLSKIGPVSNFVF